MTKRGNAIDLLAGIVARITLMLAAASALIDGLGHFGGAGATLPSPAL